MPARSAWSPSGEAMKVLILGASGIIGQHMRLCMPPGIDPQFCRRRPDDLHLGCDLTDRDALNELLEGSRPARVHPRGQSAAPGFRPLVLAALRTGCRGPALENRPWAAGAWERPLGESRHDESLRVGSAFGSGGRSSPARFVPWARATAAQ